MPKNKKSFKLKNKTILLKLLDYKIFMNNINKTL